MITKVFELGWLCLKAFTDKLCQICWKLFNLPEGALVLIFASLYFYQAMLETSHVVLKPSHILWLKVLDVLWNIIATIVGIVLLYFLIWRIPRLTNGKSAATLIGIIQKGWIGLLWVRNSAGLLTTLLFHHYFRMPDSAWYFFVCIGILMSDSDNNDGETIPAKLKRKLPKLATVNV